MLPIFVLSFVAQCNDVECSPPGTHPNRSASIPPPGSLLAQKTEGDWADVRGAAAAAGA